MVQQQTYDTTTEVFQVDPRLLGRIMDAPPEQQHEVAVEVQAEVKEVAPPEVRPYSPHGCYDDTVHTLEVALGYNPLDYTRIMGQMAHSVGFRLDQLPAPYKKIAAESRAGEVVEGEVVDPDRPDPRRLASKKLALTKGTGPTLIPQQQTKENNQ